MWCNDLSGVCYNKIDFIWHEINIKYLYSDKLPTSLTKHINHLKQDIKILLYKTLYKKQQTHSELNQNRMQNTATIEYMKQVASKLFKHSMNQI